MRIVVLGASGTMGTRLAELLRSQGHGVVPAMRASGVDAASGTGLDKAFAGADAIVDCTNFTTVSGRRAISVLGGMTNNIVDAARRANVPHLLLLSIVNCSAPALRRMGYYRGKAAQERILAQSGLPYTIVRTTQWFELAGMLLSQTRVGSFALMPHMRSAPIAAASAAELLSEVAAGPPRGKVEVAGPEVLDLLDLARVVADRSGKKVRVVPIPVPGATKALAGGALLPAPAVERRGPTFAEWVKADPTLNPG